MMLKFYQKEGTTGKSQDDYYLVWDYNDEPLNIGKADFCDDSGKCSMPESLSYFESRELDGNWDSICQNG